MSIVGMEVAACYTDKVTPFIQAIGLVRATLQSKNYEVMAVSKPA
jgi:hypothetical protein